MVIFNIAKLSCVYVCICRILYPMKTLMIFKRGTKIEHWQKVSSYRRISEGL